MGKVFIGISGWTYAGWRKRFYPAGLAHHRELQYASRQLNAIEINGTFYSLQRPNSFARWHADTPRGFRFAVKGSRFITHMKQLRDVRVPLANFFASGVLLLEEKLGPLLWQFAPRMRFNEERFRAFLDLLPQRTSDAARLAAEHDTRLDGRAAFDIVTDRRIRHAVEVRNSSFMDDVFFDLLREYNVALVFSDAAADWPYAEDVTADFVYLRLHGAEELYASGYGDDALDEWARRVRSWSDGREPRDAQRAGTQHAPKRASRDAYIFFDNDAKVRAPFDAISLAQRLGVSWKEKHEQ
jgi:uncharacterized protein YecE (DUF72 family)